jgi:hypothetical protein
MTVDFPHKINRTRTSTMFRDLSINARLSLFSMMNSLTMDEIEKYKEMFQMFDKVRNKIVNFILFQ